MAEWIHTEEVSRSAEGVGVLGAVLPAEALRCFGVLERHLDFEPLGVLEAHLEHFEGTPPEGLDLHYTKCNDST